MLRKLLKYDLKSGLRTFCVVWMGIAVLTGLVCLIFSFDAENNTAILMIGVLTMIPLMFGVIGAILYSNVFVALRFYNGLLGQEGYLMFTLPASPWKLLTSKLLTAILFVCGTAVISLLSIGFMLNAMVGTLGMDLSMMFEMTGLDLSLTEGTVLTIVSYVLNGIMGILQIYLACCLGHLCRTKRVLFSVLFYFAINTAISLISSIIQIVMVSGSALMDSSLGALSQASMGYTMGLNVGLSVLFFVICERILRTKLNLE